jgi:hypothetical protein
VLYHAASHASGEERARFRERAAFFFDYSVKTLTGMPTRTYAFQRHPAFQIDANMPDAMEFPDQEPFVPQKARAKRRLLVYTMVGGLLGLAGLLSLIVR